MLNEQSVVAALTVDVNIRGSHVPPGIHQLATAVRHAGCAAISWLRIPIRPEAALWEASFWIAQTHPNEDGCVDPDPFASESPLLRDRWPFE
jgi:hypothetical protein